MLKLHLSFAKLSLENEYTIDCWFVFPRWKEDEEDDEKADEDELGMVDTDIVKAFSRSLATPL